MGKGYSTHNIIKLPYIKHEFLRKYETCEEIRQLQGNPSKINK